LHSGCQVLTAELSELKNKATVISRGELIASAQAIVDKIVKIYSIPTDLFPNLETAGVRYSSSYANRTVTGDIISLERFKELMAPENTFTQTDPEEHDYESEEDEEDEEDDDDEDDEDKPMSRREAREFLAQQGHQTLVESNRERITDYSESVSESASEAELIREIHKNRVFPEGMSLREQIDESAAIVNYKRSQSKAVELARAIKGKDSVSTDAASTQRDPQAGSGPKIETDLAASMKRSGFNLNNKTQRYEKTLPNGKVLVKVQGQSPFLVG